VTTVLADARSGVMVSDSCVTGGDRVWNGVKVFRVRGHLLGFAGDIAPRTRFLEWWKAGAMEKDAPTFKGGQALILTPGGKLVFYEGDDLPVDIPGGREAIGTGGKVAIAAYDALGWTDPKKAVAVACRHDSASRLPVRVYKLKGAR
jgi:ATP-dependent protease HslVU (ClpYQ) peptidase subunit